MSPGRYLVLMAVPALSFVELEPALGVLTGGLPYDRRAQPAHLHVIVARALHLPAGNVQWAGAADAPHHVELRRRLAALLALLRLPGVAVQARR